MKKALLPLIGLVLISSLSSGVCSAEERTVAASQQSYQAVMKVEGMTCMGCVNKVKSTLTSLDGVQSCDVNLEESRATVVYDNKKLSDAALVEAVNRAGFTAQIGDLQMVGEHHSSMGCTATESKTGDGKGCCAMKGGKKTCSEAEKAKCGNVEGDKK